MEPFFSIIVPIYNREKYLNRCIDSILNQSFENWEAILVDDGSVDKSTEIINSYNDSRIKYFYKDNGGVSSARNLAITHSAGKYVAFLDSDDEYNETHLFDIYYLNSEKNKFPVCLICTDFSFNFNGKIVNDDNFEFMKRKPNFTHFPYVQSTAIHREGIGKERFNENLHVREDNEFIDRIRSKIPCYRIKKRSVIIHRHDSNHTADPFFAKKETEKALYYYIKTRKKFSKQEWSRLYEVLSYLTLHYFREKKAGLFFSIFHKDDHYITNLPNSLWQLKDDF